MLGEIDVCCRCVKSMHNRSLALGSVYCCLFPLMVNKRTVMWACTYMYMYLNLHCVCIHAIRVVFVCLVEILEVLAPTKNLIRHSARAVRRIVGVRMCVYVEGRGLVALYTSAGGPCVCVS